MGFGGGDRLHAGDNDGLSFYLLGSIHNSPNSEIRVDNSNTSSNDGGGYALKSGWTLGGDPDGGLGIQNPWLSGDIAEILIYSVDESSNLDEIEGYLNDEWNLGLTI